MKRLPPSAKSEHYRINNWQMECQCCYCGEPLFVGDKALEAYGNVYCSTRCAIDARQRLTVEVKS